MNTIIETPLGTVAIAASAVFFTVWFFVLIGVFGNILRWNKNP